MATDLICHRFLRTKTWQKLNVAPFFWEESTLVSDHPVECSDTTQLKRRVLFFSERFCVCEKQFALGTWLFETPLQFCKDPSRENQSPASDGVSRNRILSKKFFAFYCIINSICGAEVTKLNVERQFQCAQQKVSLTDTQTLTRILRLPQTIVVQDFRPAEWQQLTVFCEQNLAKPQRCHPFSRRKQRQLITPWNVRTQPKQRILFSLKGFAIARCSLL